MRYSEGVKRLAVQHKYSFSDYLVLEESSNVRHEFFEGEIYAMAGGTPEHAALCLAFGSELRTRLHAGRCRAFSADLRVRVVSAGLATYPDVTVVCGPLERDPESPTTVTNPTLIVEVSSPGTEDYDRGDKFELYKQMPTLREYVLVSSRDAQIEVRRRTESGRWEVEVNGPGETVRLSSVDCEIPVDDVYRGVFER